MDEIRHDFLDRPEVPVDTTPLADAPQESHPVAPDGPIPSLEEIEAEQSE